MRTEKAEADSEPSGKRWVRNDSLSVEWVGFCAAVLAVEIEDAALKGRPYDSERDGRSPKRPASESRPYNGRTTTTHWLIAEGFAGF